MASFGKIRVGRISGCRRIGNVPHRHTGLEPMLSTNPYELPEPVVAELIDTDAASANRIDLSGTLSVADVMHAHRVAARAFRSGVILGLVLPLILLAIVLLADFLGSTRMTQVFSHGALAIVCITMPLIYAVSYVRRYLWYSRQSRLHQGVFAPSHSEITPQGLSSVSEHAESRLKWSLFRGFRVSDRVVVLYVQFPSQFLIISREKLETPTQWPELVSIIEGNLPRL